MYTVGEKVVCIADSWRLFYGSVEIGPAFGPKKGEVLVVTDVYHTYGHEYLGLLGWPDGAFCALKFRKLHDDTVSRIIAQVTEKPVVIS